MMKKFSTAFSLLSSGKTHCTEDVREIHLIPPTPSTDHRWSEVVPPTAGLAFAAVWDPELGMVSFSGAELFECLDGRPPGPRADYPSDVSDNRSQVLTVDESTLRRSENTATLAVFHDVHPHYFERRTPDATRRRIPRSTLPSSTFGGFDIFIRNPRMPSPDSGNGRYSLFDILDKDLKFDPKSAFTKWEKLILRKCHLDDDSANDSGFFERQRYRASGITEESGVIVELILNSSFSTTTTSTSNYVEVSASDGDDDFDPSSWPTSDTLESTMGHVQPTSSPRRRLRKRRPANAITSPADVLARKAYNHAIPHNLSKLAFIHSERLGLPRIVRALGRWRQCPSTDDSWVCIEVTDVISELFI